MVRDWPALIRGKSHRYLAFSKWDSKIPTILLISAHQVESMLERHKVMWRGNGIIFMPRPSCLPNPEKDCDGEKLKEDGSTVAYLHLLQRKEQSTWWTISRRFCQALSQHSTSITSASASTMSVAVGIGGTYTWVSQHEWNQHETLYRPMTMSENADPQ
jgi:hypothetical protein